MVSVIPVVTSKKMHLIFYFLFRCYYSDCFVFVYYKYFLKKESKDMCGGVYCIEQKSTYLRSKLEAKFESPKFKEPFRDYRWRVIVKWVNSFSK